MVLGRAVLALGIALCGVVLAAGCADDTSERSTAGHLTEAQCAAHPACGIGIGNPTESCGDCYRLPCCPTPVCITMREACDIICGKLSDCASNDSYPGTIQCPGRHSYRECPSVSTPTMDGSAGMDATFRP